MANSNIYSGLWIDHTRNPVLGATVTLKADWGQNLISAATIVVQTIGIALWTILAYVIHQRRSTAGLRDEFEAQLQVILRNCVSADGGAWDVLSLGRTWKGRRKEVWKTTGWIGGLAAMVYVGFLVAGIFVGQISTNSYDAINVLIDPDSCGFIDIDSDARAGISNVQINVSTNAQQYARSCYGGGGIASAVSCSVYPVSNLNYTVERQEQPCPIPADTACFSGDQAATPITLKTGKVDSHHHLGINARKQDRLSIEYQTTCAPLNYDFVDEFIITTESTVNDTFYSSTPQNGTIEVYTMGPWSQFDQETPYTFTYSPNVRQWGVGTLSYSADAFISYAPHNNPNISIWQPLAPFNQSMGDLSIIRIMPNGVTFTAAVDDPMFRTFDEPDPTLYGGAQYVPRRNVYLLACSEQWRLSNERNQKSTGWNTTYGLLDSDYWVKELDLNPAQNATYSRLVSSIFQSNMFSSVFGVPDPLLASYSLITQTGSQALPNGHWRREVEGWFQSVLAKWQFLPTVFVNIPLSILEDNNIKFLPASIDGPEMEKQCHQQRITAPQIYQSYSLFALVFIAFMGVLVPGIALLLKSSHRFGIGKAQDHPYLSYQAEGLLQLHRMALENAGYTTWEDGVKDKPRTPVATKRLPQVVLERDDLNQEMMLRYPRAGNRSEEDVDEGSGSSTLDDKGRLNGYQEVPKNDLE